MNKSKLRGLITFITERENVRLLKEAGAPKPWTKDKVLQQFRFCNVRRMDDKVSKWLLGNWYQPNHNHRSMLLACALGRLFNLPSTLEQIGYPRTWSSTTVAKIKAKVVAIRAKGVKPLFNNAYLIAPLGLPDKLDAVFDVVLSQLTPKLGDDLAGQSRLETAHKMLTKVKGLGSFMAGQILADFSWGQDVSWEDVVTWAAKGPGSHRGMNRLLGLPIRSPMTQAKFAGHLDKLISVLEVELPPGLVRRLEAIDYQNCLCEYDKYRRFIEGQGRPKARYPGAH